MASSSRAGEGADKVANEIPEDLVLSWTRDATTINIFETLVEKDRQLLQELIQCVHKGKDTNGIKQKLSALFGTGKDRKPVVIRARVLTRLIAIALGLHLDDIAIDSKTGKESLRPSVVVDFQTALGLRLAEALADDNSVLSYLFKDALEADDEVMTVIFCDPRFFEKYPVPYFHGCDLFVVQEITNLWLSQEFLRGFYYYTVLEPLFMQVKAEPSKVAGRPPKNAEENSHMATISEGNLFKGTLMLCEFLQKRTVMAGARLLEVSLRFRNDTIDRVRELVKGLVTPLVGFKNGKFRKCLFQNLDWEEWRRSQGSDQELEFLGQSITVGPSSAQTDSNLLCWAARRGYSNLIWCISLGYTKARPKSASGNLLEDAMEALEVSLLWKVALWCATRHGQDSVVMELTRPEWVKHIDFNDYAWIQDCLPPLHLVSLLGDRSLLRILCMGKVGIEFGALKVDYLGNTPLDYATQFQVTAQFQVTTKNPQSCMRELLQMPGVVDRLKELNDMYITQVNFVLVGAALIASVAFVGWLQPPLGYIDYFQFTQPSPPTPTSTFGQYIAVEGHLSVQMFVVFNTLSFFLGIGTMMFGAVATFFVQDNNIRTLALMNIRKSIKWMLGFFITSMVCIMVTFICAGLAILPPNQRLKWSMIVSLCLGACICLIPLTWILSSLARDQLVKLKYPLLKLIMQSIKEKKLDDFVKDLGGSLVNELDEKTLQDEIERRRYEQPYVEPSSKFEESYMENQIPNASKRMHSFNPRLDSFKLDDGYDNEYEYIDYPPMERRRYGR